jgi:hypothetical protein
MIKVYIVECVRHRDPFIIGERILNKYYKYSYRKQIFISKEFARKLIKNNKFLKKLNKFCRENLYEK